MTKPIYPRSVLDKASRELSSIGALDLAHEAGISTPIERALSEIITADDHTVAAKRQAERLSPHCIPVLILGETGTGKELFAKVLHGNRTGRLVCINCGGIPDTLIEGEFFGTTKGSHTGAINRPGFFEQARDGTIFLDEIAELERGLQSKLLRVLQEKRVRRLGGECEIPINCRVVSATNYPVSELKGNNKLFRADLFYRLAGSVIKLNPLRKRGDDAQLIADLVTRQIGFPLPPTKEAEVLWPGNIRELLNYIEEWKILNEDKYKNI